MLKFATKIALQQNSVKAGLILEVECSFLPDIIAVLIVSGLMPIAHGGLKGGPLAMMAYWPSLEGQTRRPEAILGLTPMLLLGSI